MPEMSEVGWHTEIAGKRGNSDVYPVCANH